MSWDWQVFFQDTGGGQTYLNWMMSAWGWTLLGVRAARWSWRWSSAR